MPWKAMVYKSLNTFIDGASLSLSLPLPLSFPPLLLISSSDLFAFVIKMPLMHRLACFRDDIIFFIYLYQRWVYAVDMSRVNEFGQGGEDGDDQPPAGGPPQGGAEAATTKGEERVTSGKEEGELR
jgi:hypothetical protein